MYLTNSTNHEIKSYPRRWFVLFIAMTNHFLRTFNQTSFGNINNVYAKYFNKDAWQIDWLVISQAVTWIVSVLPMMIIAKKMNVRSALCITTACSSVGYFITAGGHLTRNGYSAVLVGQVIEGIGGIVSGSLTALVSTVWFPSHQVAIAVAAQVVSAGIGEASGSIIPPYIVSMNSTSQQVKWNLFILFAALTAMFCSLFIMSVLFTSGPPTPPSVAELKSLDLRKREQSAHFNELIKSAKASIKTLFTSKTFLLLWFSSGASLVALRTNNILLSSMLHKTFPGASHIDKNVGVFIGVAWLLSTLGGFVAGPIIAKTHRFKEIVLAGVILLLLSATMLLIGIQYQNLYVVYSAVLVQGFSHGVVVTSLTELFIEVTYPESIVFVVMLIAIIVGSFRLIYPIGERALLESVDATAANLLPVVLIFVSFVLIMFVTKDYRRSLANNEQEVKILVNSSPNYGTQIMEE